MPKKVTIYSTATCPYCVRLKDHLKKNNVEFTEIDVSTDPKKGEEMVQKSGQMGVPVVDIGGKIIVGFDKDAIDKELRS